MQELVADDPDFVRVDDHEDAEAIADPSTFGDFTVSFSDLAAHDYAHLVAQTVAVVASFPGVEQALHEDRELILVWGLNVDKPALQTALREWWMQQLSRS